MQFSQSNSVRFLFWHRTLATCLILLPAAACSDRLDQAMQYAAEADQELQAGRIASAREKIGDALGERDDLPELYLLRGRIELAAGAYGNAYAAYANALSLDNTNIEALQAVSQLGLRAGNVRESLDATERLLALQPDDQNALITRGVHAFLQRRFQDAVDYAERVLQQEPANEEARILKSRALFMAGRPVEALKVVNAQTGLGPSVGIARTKLELYRELRDPGGMQVQFDLLRQLAPDDSELRVDEADLQFKLGKALAGRALIADLLARKDLATEAAAQAIGVLQAYQLALSDSDVARVAAHGSKASRIELARQMIASKQANPAELLIRGLPATDAQPLAARIAVIRNDPKRALAVAHEVLGKDETECDAQVAVAEASLTLGRSLDALRNGQRAAAECPNRAYAWLATAAAYAARGEAAGVERAFRDATEANPQNFALAMAFGNWLMANGRSREALAIARTFTRKSPALLRGWNYYSALCTRSHNECRADAEQGLDDARSLYGPDRDVGKLPTGGLFGRLVRR